MKPSLGYAKNNGKLGRSRRTDVQVLRAVAVLAVILFHAGFHLPGGFSGVDIFFVVSGFVISQLLINEFNTEGRIRFGKFFQRRIRRLVPAASVMVASVAALTLMVYPTFSVFEPMFVTGLAGIFFTANVFIDRISWDYFAPVSEWNPFLHLWSLGVEEQFYLAFPFLLVFLVRLLSRKLVFGLCTVALVSLVLSWVGSSDYRIFLPFGQSFIGFYSPISRVWEFLIGAIVALIGVCSFGSLVTRFLRILGWLGLALSFILLQPGGDDRTLQLLLPVLSTALILFCGDFSSGGHNLARKAISGLARIGDWSYSLYLWHWPLMVLGTYALPGILAIKGLTLLASVPLALMTYYLVENPIRHAPVGSGASRTKLSVGIAGLSIGVLMVTAVSMVSLIEPRMRASATWLGDFQSPIATISDEQLRNCSTYVNCVETGPDTGPKILVLGDSHSADLFYGLSSQFSQYTVRRIAGSEAYLDTESDLHRQILDDSSVKMVVVAHYFGAPSMSFDWQSFEIAMTSFTSSGKSAVIVDDWPNIRIDPYRCALGLPVSPDYRVCEIDSGEPSEVRDRYFPELVAIVNKVPSVSLLPAFEFFCNEEKCQIGTGDEVWFRDSNHLTTEGSLRVVEYWLQEDRALVFTAK